jgi:hypothetical protein
LLKKLEENVQRIRSEKKDCQDGKNKGTFSGRKTLALYDDFGQV